MTRWSRRDDEAYQAQVEAEKFAREHVIPALAARLGVDEDRLQRAATVRAVPVRPCRHWRCRWARAATVRAFVTGAAAVVAAYGLARLIGGAW